MSGVKINSEGKQVKEYGVSDGIETIRYEKPDNTEYKQYLEWISIIKEMCTADRKVKPSPEPVYEDHVIKVGEEYAEQSYEIAREEYEWDMQHFVLDNGLHVYIKDEEIKILSEKSQLLSYPSGMTLEDGQITFLLGGEGPYSPYHIRYFASGEKIMAELPVRGTLESNTSIKEILKAGLQYGQDNDKSTIIERYTNAINVHNKISELRTKKITPNQIGQVTQHASVTIKRTADGVKNTEIGKEKDTKNNEGEEVRDDN